MDGVDHIVQETSTADPEHPVEDSVFIPEHLFPPPLAWTWSMTKGADLNWAPISFERTFRLAYSRTRYGTGYYIYHLYDRSAKLSHPVRSWDGETPPDKDVLELVSRAGTDIAPRPGTPQGRALGVKQIDGGPMSLGKNIALVYVPPAYSALGTILYVEIRGQKYKAQVVATPFYKRQKKAAAPRLA